jgi:uncharacterized membrane-anchored protein YhcB (DUF1043 family)
MPEVLNDGTLSEQIDYIEQRTRIYENYRAIREDMYQKLVRNSIDSLNSAKGDIHDLVLSHRALQNSIDSLNSTLNSTRQELDKISRTKNSISLFGLQLNKITYNTIMFAVIGGLLFLLVAGYLSFIRNRAISNYTKKEFEELKNEFDSYRSESREAREKLVMTHFNEIKRLRGG